LSSDAKYFVKVYASPKPKKIPKVVTEGLKGAVSGKMVSKMKKESVDCPVVKAEVGFLICFSCPSFLRRVSGEVHCAGEPGPPRDWLIG
jgi:hypothetical protein